MGDTVPKQHAHAKSNVLHNFAKTCNHAKSQHFFGFFKF